MLNQKALVIVGLTLSSISDGFIFGQLSGMLDALHKEDKSIDLSNEDISWIASVVNITCFCGFILVTVITEAFGRRIAVTFATIPLIISWIMTYLAYNRSVLLVSRFLSGVSYGGVLFLSYINVGEYMSPNIRFMSYNMLICVGSLVGTMLGHVLSVLLHWRTVALIGLIPTTLSAIIPCFWVESPLWLAGKGRYEECEKEFRALHDPGPAAEEELKVLILVEKEKRDKHERGNNFLFTAALIWDALKQGYYWRLLTLQFMINIYRVAAGRILFSTLAITILQGITGSSNILVFTLITNGFAIFGASVSCILLRKFKMRQLLFSSGVIANIVLISLGVVLYVRPEKDNIINWVKVSFLSIYLVITGAGSYPVIESVLTEINPLELKTLNIFLQGIFTGIIQFLAIKLAPDMFSRIGYHGVFFLNAIVVFLCLAYIWVYLPETKGRTLQEIELYFKNNSFYNNTLQRETINQMESLNKNI